MANKTAKRKKVLVCEGCGVKATDVDTCIDPYQLDINNTEVEVNLCDICYSDRVSDI
jgi:hypothetical protein